MFFAQYMTQKESYCILTKIRTAREKTTSGGHHREAYDKERKKRVAGNCLDRLVVLETFHSCDHNLRFHQAKSRDHFFRHSRFCRNDLGGSQVVSLISLSSDIREIPLTVTIFRCDLIKAIFYYMRVYRKGNTRRKFPLLFHFFPAFAGVSFLLSAQKDQNFEQQKGKNSETILNTD